MTTAASSFTRGISGEIREYKGEIFSAAALPSSTSAYSDAFEHAGIANGLEIVVAANSAITVGATKELTFTLFGCSTKNGAYTKIAEMAKIAGSSAVSSGAEIARFVPDSKAPAYMKIQVADGEDLSSASVNAYLVRKGF